MQWIYQMRRVRVSRGNKLILHEVTLTFLPGAIGIVGPNGAGKSTVLKIMEGCEQPSGGEAALAPGASVGLLPQEPVLDEGKTVLENIEAGVAETRAMLARFHDLTERLAEDAPEELLDEMGRLQEELDHRSTWELDSRLDQAMEALRCPPADAEVGSLSGASGAGWRCARYYCASPTCCCSMSPRTTWTPKTSSGSNSTWRSAQARSSRSPTTDTP